MCQWCNPTAPAAPGAFMCDDASAAGGTSRRQFLKAGAGIAAGGAASQLLVSGQTLAQGSGNASSDAELARVQGARRALLKGGVVLTLDRQVGDFAQADVLIEDGRIREVRPNITADAMIVDAGNRILAPGFV